MSRWGHLQVLMMFKDVKARLANESVEAETIREVSEMCVTYVDLTSASALRHNISAVFLVPKPLSFSSVSGW